MKKTVFFILILHLFLISLFIFTNKDKESPVIKYFPLDEDVTFQDSETIINLLSEKGQSEYEIQWKTSSKLNEPVYLRQDVSLLFVDGKLKGILSKWKENGQNIFQETTLHGEDSSHFKAVTFHHAEIHHADDVIKSIQTMSKADLYVIDSPYSALESFISPTDSKQTEWKKTLDHATNQQLNYHWNELIRHFNIKKQDYISIPLTELPDYEQKKFPNISRDETQQVIGQLWEGLYKSYILGITGEKDQEDPIKSFIPLILIDKEGTHLYFLYEDRTGNKKQLIQYFPSSQLID